MGVEAYQDYHHAIHDPATVHATLEDYRAGLGVDRDHENADRRAGRRLSCPLLILWSGHDDLEGLYEDPLSVWEDWADDLRGGRIDSGHHMAEDAPEDLARALCHFMGRPADCPRSAFIVVTAVALVPHVPLVSSRARACRYHRWGSLVARHVSKDTVNYVAE